MLNIGMRSRAPTWTRLGKRYILYTVKTARFGIPLVFLLALLSCAREDPFPEYRGVNLVASHGFGADWIADQTQPYMVFEEASADAGSASPSGGAVYRLEIRNLMPNGDFESTTAGQQPAGWTATDAGVTYYVSENKDAEFAIEGKSLYLTIPKGDWRLNFDLRNASTGLSDGFKEGAMYLWRFLFRSEKEKLIAEINNNADTAGILITWNQSRVGTEADIQTFPASNISYPEVSVSQGLQSYYFCIGTLSYEQTAQTAGIDNIRITRTDLSYMIRLGLLYSEAGRLPLLSGTYRFSMYIKADPIVTPAYPNRFPAQAVSLGINSSTSGTLYPAVYKPTDSGADWTNWTLVSGDFQLQIDPPASGTENEPVIELFLSPSNYVNGFWGKDIGSILIADPYLEFVSQ